MATHESRRDRRSHRSPSPRIELADKPRSSPPRSPPSLGNLNSTIPIPALEEAEPSSSTMAMVKRPTPPPPSPGPSFEQQQLVLTAERPLPSEPTGLEREGARPEEPIVVPLSNGLEGPEPSSSGQVKQGERPVEGDVTMGEGEGEGEGGSGEGDVEMV